jgi:hypothetical protein
VPYQDYYQETNATGTYDVALFNYNAALTLCAARGMALPSLAEMNTLHGEKPDPSSSDNWPVERPYWTREPLDTGNNGQVYDLVSGSATLSPILTPAGVTCVYSGILASLNTVVDNQYVSGTPATGIWDEVEALVTSSNGAPVALRNVYFYSDTPGLIFNQKQAATDANGKARIGVSSSTPGTFTVYANYLTQTLNTAVTFINNVLDSLIISGGNEVRMGQSINLTAMASYSSGDDTDVTMDATWQSNNTSTATVSSGTVTGVWPGTVNISATYSGMNSLPHPVTVFAGLTRVDVTPSTATMNTGENKSFSATAYFDDTSSLDITELATWFSSNSGVADVSSTAGSKGVVTAITPGDAVIQALYTDHGISQIGSANVTVISPGPTLTSLEVSPSSGDIGIGSNHPQQLTVTAHYSDGSSKSATNLATYTSSDNALATVNGTGLIAGVYHGDGVVITASYTDGEVTQSGQSTVNVKRNPTSLNLTPDSMTLKKGETQSYSYTTYFDDGSSEIDFDSTMNGYSGACINITWTNGNPSIIVDETAHTVTGGEPYPVRPQDSLECYIRPYFDPTASPTAKDFISIMVTN